MRHTIPTVLALLFPVTVAPACDVQQVVSGNLCGYHAVQQQVVQQQYAAPVAAVAAQQYVAPVAAVVQPVQAYTAAVAVQPVQAYSNIRVVQRVVQPQAIYVQPVAQQQVVQRVFQQQYVQPVLQQQAFGYGAANLRVRQNLGAAQSVRTKTVTKSRTVTRQGRAGILGRVLGR
jgi:hypothetical protein